MIVKNFLRLVRFGHTVFAMPFALTAYFYALRLAGGRFDWRVLALLLSAMVFARNAAMGFNRLVDRRFDAANPRTAAREIPRGIVTARQAALFVAANAVFFAVAAALINPLTGALAPLALFVILGYSYTKRFTAWCHIVLGVGLAMAPIGAYMAVTRSIGLVPMVLAALVMTWVAGFDILYARADTEFDRSNGLHSVPARFSDRKALTISALLHTVSAYSVAAFGLFTGRGTFYWVGSALFVSLLILQHSRKKLPFDWVNGAGSCIFAACTIFDFYV